MKKLFRGCLGLIGLVVVIAVIVAAMSSGGDDSKKTDRTASASTGSSSKPKDKSKLNPETGQENRVKVGGAYTLGDFKINRGWKVKKFASIGYSVEGLEVENLTDSDHMFSVDVKLHQGAHRIVASITCLADEAHPKDIVSVDCLPDGTETKPFDYVTIENSF